MISFGRTHLFCLGNKNLRENTLKELTMVIYLEGFPFSLFSVFSSIFSHIFIS